MVQFLQGNGDVNDFSGEWMHHGIHLPDRKCEAPKRLETVILHPVKYLKNHPQ